METDFKNKKLIILYENGKHRKYKFVDVRIYRKFLEKVNRILAADNINDLRFPQSNHFEKLTGHESRFSLRVDRKIRLEFEIDFEDEAKTKGKCWIIELSQHYK